MNLDSMEHKQIIRKIMDGIHPTIGKICSEIGYSMITNLKASVSSCFNASDLLIASSVAQIYNRLVRSEIMAH